VTTFVFATAFIVKSYTVSMRMGKEEPTAAL